MSELLCQSYKTALTISLEMLDKKEKKNDVGFISKLLDWNKAIKIIHKIENKTK